VGESHFGHEKMFVFLTRIIKEMQGYFGKNIQVYFELFGGSYPHPNVPVDKRFSRVAKGIWYCPTIDIRVIDIRVDDIYLDYDEMVEIAERHRLKVAKCLGRGTLDQMLEISPEFEDETYKEYGLPKIENNFSEGLVIRPTKECLFSNGKRVILKNKCKRMSERRERKPKVPVSLTDQEEMAFNSLASCVTEARLDNVLSHGHQFDKKGFSKLVGLVMQDIFDEDKEIGVSIELEDKASRKKVNKLLQMEVIELVKPFWINLINDF
jgi:Rnl2 family RNA ligase